MKVATILPTEYLGYTADDEYFMCLAHLMKSDRDYRNFFDKATRRGFVLMDNGVVETGVPLDGAQLLKMAVKYRVNEMVLPDQICDPGKSIYLGLDTISLWEGEVGLMAVPQGRTFEEWKNCMRVMLSWPISAIGISKFTKTFGLRRDRLLENSRELIDSNIDIHILGCNATDDELYWIEQKFPGRIRGVDSGIAAIYSQEGLKMHPFTPKPEVELKFSNKEMNESLLVRNIDAWKKLQFRPPIEEA